MKTILFLSSLSLTLTIQTAQTPKNIARLIRAATAKAFNQRHQAQQKLITILQNNNSFPITEYDSIVSALDHDGAFSILKQHKTTLTIALASLSKVSGFLPTLHQGLAKLTTPAQAQIPFSHIKAAINCIEAGEQINALNQDIQCFDWSKKQTFNVVTDKRWVAIQSSLKFPRTKKGRTAEETLKKQFIEQQKIVQCHNKQNPTEQVQLHVATSGKIPPTWKQWFKDHHIKIGKI